MSIAWKFVLCILLPSWNLFYGLSILGLAVHNGKPITISNMLSFSDYGAEMSGLFLLTFAQIVLHFFIMFSFDYVDHQKKKPKSWINQMVPRFIVNKLKLDLNQSKDVELVENSGDEDEQILQDCLLRIEGIHKWYGEYHALRSVSFGVKRGEVFGLLGKNGASKTTLLNAISGITGIAQGSISIGGQDLYNSLRGSMYKSLGVCPQNNRLYENLTVWEHVKIYHLIRGTYSRENVQQVLSKFKFAPEDVNKAIKELSGGMKRKLSVALSFVGNPDVILLDEPSSGMDVAIRRRFWSLINEMRENHAIILTSQSLEEIENLSSRIGIMVEGRMAVIGTKNSLKNKYGKAYQLQITNKYEEDVERTEEFITNTFGRDNVKLLNCVGRTQSFEIDGSLEIYELFEKIGGVVNELAIQDYSISQTTLEQVFLNFSSKYKV